MQSEALVRSPKITPIMFLLFKAFKISEIMLLEAASVDNIYIYIYIIIYLPMY
jgi:hypothetical protein